MGEPGCLDSGDPAGVRSWCLRRVGMEAEWLLLEAGREVRRGVPRRGRGGWAPPGAGADVGSGPERAEAGGRKWGSALRPRDGGGRRKMAPRAGPGRGAAGAARGN